MKLLAGKLNQIKYSSASTLSHCTHGRVYTWSVLVEAALGAVDRRLQLDNSLEERCGYTRETVLALAFYRALPCVSLHTLNFEAITT